MKKLSSVILVTVSALVLFLFFNGCSKKQEQVKTSSTIQLFNGTNLDGWHTCLVEKGVNNDPDTVFSVKDSMIHISGKVNGYVCTNNEYENYKLTVEYRWGDVKYVAEDVKQNSGILYHFPQDSTDKIWPYAIECQLMNGNVGDYILMGPSVTINGVTGTPENRVFAKTQDAEKPIGEWNTVQVICQNDSSKHIVNGVLVNKGGNASVQKGKILIQSEGAELFIRKVELETL